MTLVCYHTMVLGGRIISTVVRGLDVLGVTSGLETAVLREDNNDWARKIL